MDKFLDNIGDTISKWTGYAAIRVPLDRGTPPNEFTIDIPGYRQIDSYSCGAVAGAMVLKYFHPNKRFEDFYGDVDPCREYGTSTGKLTKALRSNGITVSERKDLNFNSLCQEIAVGHPIITCICTKKSDTYHWITIYGYGRKPNQVFAAGNGIPLLQGQRYSWWKFKNLWSPSGHGLVCKFRRNGKKSAPVVRR